MVIVKQAQIHNTKNEKNSPNFHDTTHAGFGMQTI